MSINLILEEFINNTVNLNPDRKRLAEEKIETIKSFLKNSEEYKELFIDFVPQGSYRQDTIIKPPAENKEFDVDGLFLMKEVPLWTPKDYISNLKSLFKSSDRYKDIVDGDGKTRCVTISYAGDFHMDVVPCIQQNGRYYIMNKKDDIFEETDADGYAEWFESKDAVTGGKLVLIVKLIKYLRDIKQNFSVKSVLLTTLLGMQVHDTDNVALYEDIPTALKTLLGRLNDFLQASISTPIILNPILSSENFNRHWDKYPGQYPNFREKIKLYTEKINEALEEEDEEKSIKKLQEVFGDELKCPEIEKNITIKTASALFTLGDHSHKQSLADVGLVDTGNYPYTVEVSTSLYAGSRSNPRIVRPDFQSDEILPILHHLTFTASPNVPHRNFDIYWQVVNTGEHAKSLGRQALRGEIIKGGKQKWEQSLYTGKHWVECFIIDTTTNACIARSGRFYVNFENSSYPLK